MVEVCSTDGATGVEAVALVTPISRAPPMRKMTTVANWMIRVRTTTPFFPLDV